MSLRVWDLPDDLQKRIHSKYNKCNFEDMVVDDMIYILLITAKDKVEQGLGFKLANEYLKLAGDIRKHFKKLKETKE